MRMKIDSNPTFPLLFDDGKLQIVSDYKKKYDSISDILDMNPAALHTVHEGLKEWGSDNGRDSTYSSEQLFRALVVKWTEGTSFRDTIVRIADSTVLRNFTRLNSGKVMNFTVLNTAFKKIKHETWDTVNTILEQWAKKEGKISGTSLRLDSTVCESNIHYPTDAHLLWDCYRVASRIMERIREDDRMLVMGHRFHTAKIKRLYTFIATHATKKNKSTIRKVRKTKDILLQRIEAIIATAQQVVDNGKTEWEEEIDIFSMGKKGSRTPEEIAREHGMLFKLVQKFRAGCEGSISVLKRVFGLRRCLNRGFNSFAASVGCLVFCHNLVVLSKL